jgi:putative transposase
MANEDGKKKAPRGKRYTEDEILKILKEIEGGASIASVGRAHGVTDQTLYRWREKYGGMESSELKELKALQAENLRLKRIVTRQALEIDAYKEVTEGKW